MVQKLHKTLPLLIVIVVVFVCFALCQLVTVCCCLLFWWLQWLVACSWVDGGVCSYLAEC